MKSPSLDEFDGFEEWGFGNDSDAPASPSPSASLSSLRLPSQPSTSPMPAVPPPELRVTATSSGSKSVSGGVGVRSGLLGSRFSRRRFGPGGKIATFLHPAFRAVLSSIEPAKHPSGADLWADHKSAKFARRRDRPSVTELGIGELWRRSRQELVSAERSGGIEELRNSTAARKSPSEHRTVQLHYRRSRPFGTVFATSSG